MTDAFIFTLAQKAIWVTLQLSGPILAISLVVGILVSILQAVTQIQDVTLSFVPKILSVILAVVIFGPWMLRVMVEFTYGLIVMLPNVVR